MNTDRFDEMEAAVFRGKPWMFRDPSAPNPLTIEASGWSTGHTTLGEAEFLQGVDRDGQKWSVLVGSVILNKRLIEGVVEAWDPEKEGFAVVRVEGRVQPGEIVSMFYKGDRQGAKYSYPDFDVARKPLSEDEAAARAAYEAAAELTEDEKMAEYIASGAAEEDSKRFESSQNAGTTPEEIFGL